MRSRSAAGRRHAAGQLRAQRSSLVARNMSPETAPTFQRAQRSTTLMVADVTVQRGRSGKHSDNLQDRAACLARFKLAVGDFFFTTKFQVSVDGEGRATFRHAEAFGFPRRCFQRRASSGFRQPGDCTNKPGADCDARDKCNAHHNVRENSFSCFLGKIWIQSDYGILTCCPEASELPQ